MATEGWRPSEEVLRIHVGRSDFNADDWRLIRYKMW